MQLSNKTVLVYGAAKSGISSAGLLQKLGANVILFDRNTNLTEEALEGRIDTDSNFSLVTANLPDEIMNRIDLLVISPGVPTDHPDIIKIRENNIPICGEIELAYLFSKGKRVGITGTNGKTTTTMLTGEILKAWYKEVFVVGNIGNAYTDIALDTSDQSIAVIELSSFQLETIHEFRPEISAILNITPDHLDRHYSMENYINAKERIAMNQTKADLCILNYEDEILRKMAEQLKAQVLFFSSFRELVNGCYLVNDEIIYSRNGEKQAVCNVNELHILGLHNYENVMAAVLIAEAMKIPMESIRKSVLAFRGVEHRIEYVKTIGDVCYYNDSKGTNPDASIRAVKAMKNPTVLIAGGYDKKIPFDDLIEAFDDKIRFLILIGQTKEQIAETAIRHGFTNIIMAESLKEAVNISFEKAEAGDAVLLSPACASFGMFENYEQRGKLFKKYVSEL